MSLVADTVAVGLSPGRVGLGGEKVSCLVTVVTPNRKRLVRSSNEKPSLHPPAHSCRDDQCMRNDCEITLLRHVKKPCRLFLPTVEYHTLTPPAFTGTRRRTAAAWEL